MSRDYPTARWPLLLAFALAAASVPRTSAAAEPAFSAIAAGSFDEATWLFAADAESGMVSIAKVVPQGEGPVRGLQPYLRLERPTALAFHDGKLYICDAAESRLLAVDMAARTPRDLVRGAPLHRPGAMAISPEGLIAVAEPDLRAIVWVTGEGKPAPFLQQLPAGVVPEQLAFAGEQLLVLDAATRSIFTLPAPTGTAYGSMGQASAGGAPLALEPRPGPLDAMAADADVLYFAAGGRLAAAPQAAHPAGAGPAPFAGQELRLATSAYSVFFTRLGAGEVLQQPRPIPVDVRLEVDYALANRALWQLHQYAIERNLVSLREVTAPGQLPLRDLLVKERVLVGPAGAEAVRAARLANLANQVNAGYEKPAAVDETALLRSVLCKLNTLLCRQLESSRNPLAIRFPEGTRLVLPAVEIRSVIRRTQRELSGASIAELLTELVFDPALREKVGREEYLERLNSSGRKKAPAKMETQAADLLTLRAGRVYLPAEAWEVTAAVLATDLRDDSEIRAALRAISPQIFVLSKESLAASGAALMAQDATAAPGEGCDELRSQRRKLKETIGYPGPDATVADVFFPIGIVEDGGKTDRGHLAFLDGGQQPAWWKLGEDSLPVSDPVAEPFQGEPTSVVVHRAAAASDPTAWHGSHVAGIIGARDGCGGGLLPGSRFFAIQDGSPGDVGRAIRNAVTADVRVVNVSQEFGGASRGDEWNGVRDIIESSSSVLFVAAAGNGGLRLDGSVSVAAPVAWAAIDSVRPNLVIVTATDWDKELLPQEFPDHTKGPNRGKAYVDLAAPGNQIYSCTAKNEFEPRTGTSQAAPQVTAAAALLMERGCKTPASTKARLIATADWLSGLEDSVWGGLLDYGAAVFEPDADILTVFSRPNEVFRVKIRDAPIDLPPDAREYSRGEDSAFAPPRIMFSKILSLRQRNGGFRVVYLGWHQTDLHHFHVVLGTTLESPRLACTAEQWDPASSSFVPSDLCTSGLAIDQIETYFHRCDYQQVKF